MQCRKKLEEIFLVELEKKKKKNENGGETHDLMDGLMQIRDEEGNKLVDQEVLDNIVSLVAAGYESTSLASMWALYYLSKFPNVLEKLRV
jgi:cytochrome P450